jgi:c-di-GMP-binding flagellar brake protein YcgR
LQAAFGWKEFFLFEHGFFIAIPDRIEVMLFALLGLSLMALAVVIELYRRRRERRLRHEAELRAVMQIAREKELPERERNYLLAFVKTHGRQAPLRTVTVKQEFDQCVEEEMNDLEAANEPEKLEERGVLLRDIRINLGLDYIPLGQRIHSTRELHYNQTLWASRTDGAAEKWWRMYISGIDEACFRIAPRDAEEKPGFKTGTEIRFRLWRENDARYVFSAQLLRLIDRPRQFVFRHAPELKRIQSRAWYRLRYEKNGPIEVLNAPADNDYSDVADREAVTTFRVRYVNLSAGGFAAVISQPLPKQVVLRAILDLGPDFEAQTVYARPLHAGAISAGRYLLRAAFIEMPEDTREVIARYIMETQKPQHPANAEEATDGAH